MKTMFEPLKEALLPQGSKLSTHIFLTKINKLPAEQNVQDNIKLLLQLWQSRTGFYCYIREPYLNAFKVNPLVE